MSRWRDFTRGVVLTAELFRHREGEGGETGRELLVICYREEEKREEFEQKDAKDET